MSWLPKSPKARRRLWIVLAAAPVLALAVGLSLWAMRGSVTYFFTPSEVTEQAAPAGRNVRLGGLVAAGSGQSLGPRGGAFPITDKPPPTPVVYHGRPPDPFGRGATSG